MVDPGVHALPMADYLALPYASSSRLWTLHTRSAWHVRNETRRAGAAASHGTLTHAMVFEPDAARERYVPFVGDLRTKAGRAEWENIENTGREPVRLRDYEAAAEQAAQIRTAAQDVLRSVTAVERVLVWDDRATGVRCKARPDAMTRFGLLDLKTTRDGSPRAFLASCRRYGHHWQASHYIRGARALGLPCDEWRWIVAERGGPVAVYEASLEQLDQLAFELDGALRAYAACERSGAWPGYAHQRMDLSALFSTDSAGVDFSGIGVEDEEEMP